MYLQEELNTDCDPLTEPKRLRATGVAFGCLPIYPRELRNPPSVGFVKLRVRGLITEVLSGEERIASKQMNLVDSI